MAAGQQQLKEGEGEVLGGARPTVELRTVLEGALERIHAEFGSLLNTAASCNDEDRKRHILSSLHAWRQQLLRLVSLVQWHPKAKALLPCVQQGQVLDTARRHAQMLDAAAVELYNSHTRRVPDSCPMADVQTALDVLSTGTYTDLPTSIAKLGRAGQHSPDQQQKRLRQISHLVLSHLLRASLPPGLEVSELRNGYAVLTAPGLYSAKVTLIPGAKLPPEPAAQQGGTGEGGAAGAQPAAVGVATVNNGTSKQDEEEDEEVTSGKPAARWKWLLLEFSIPVNMIRGEALQPAQKQGLLHDLNDRMDKAADHAVYELRRRHAHAAQGKQEGAEAGVGPSGLQPSASMGPQGSLSKPSASGPTTTSSRAGAAAAAGAGRADKLRAQNLALLEQHAADEVSAPLAMMHVVLADIASRLVLDAARTVTQQLVAASGCWHGHAQYQLGTSSKALELGFSVVFWTKAIPLAPAPSTQAAGAAGSSMPPPGPSKQQGTLQPSRPTLEVGIASNGTVQVHLLGLNAALKRTGTVASLPAAVEATQVSSDVRSGQQEVDLQLNPVTVNIDELLLQAASRVAWQELQLVRDQLARELQSTSSPSAAWGLRLTTASMQLQPATARQLLDQMTVQQAVLSCTPTATSATAVGNARQGRALQSAMGTVLIPQNNSYPDAASAQPAASMSEELQVEVEFPVLEFWSQGELLVKLSKSLFTGRLLLQPGPGLAGDANLQALTSWGQKEEDINALLGRLHAQPVSSAVHSGPSHIVSELCQRLALLMKEQQRSMAISKCMSAARQLQLHLGGPSTRVVTAFHQENPWADVKRFYTLWSMPPTPFPADFPTLYACPTGTHTALQPRCLSFVIGAADPSHARPSYSLFVVACSAQMLPLSVMKAVPVPQHAFTSMVHKVDDGPDAPSRLQRLHSSHVSLSLLAGASGDHYRELSAGGAMDIDGEVTTMTGHLTAADRAVSAKSQRARSPSPFGRQAATGQGRDAWVSGGGAASMGGADASAAAGPTRDVHQEMVCVVRWCQQRAVWEKLVAQLKAVSAQFAELPLSLHANSNASQAAQPSIHLLSFAGIQMPCRIARRKGLQPARVGPRRIALSVGQNTDQEHVDVTLSGTWFSSQDSYLQQSSTTQQGAGPSPTPAGIKQGHIKHEPGGQAVMGGGSWHGPSTTQGEQGWLGLRARSCTQLPGGQVQLSYHFAQGQSVLDVLCDVLCMLRLQTFLARLESMAQGPGELHVSCRHTAASVDKAAEPVTQQTAGRVGVKRERMHEDVEPGPVHTKKARGLDDSCVPITANGNGHIQPHSAGVDGHHDSIAGNGHAANGPATGIEASPQPGLEATSSRQSGISWVWPGNSTVRLASYSLTHATLCCTANSSTKLKAETEDDKKLQTGPQQLSMTVRWCSRHSHRHGERQLHGTSTLARIASAGRLTPAGSSSAPHASTQPSLTGTTTAPAMRWSDLVKCQISMHGDHGHDGLASAGTQGSGWSEAACTCLPSAAPLPSTQQHHNTKQGLSIGRQQGPWAEFQACLEEMADDGEEGLLLDALAIAAQPMHALQAAVDAWHTCSSAQQGAGGTAGQPPVKAALHVVHVPGSAPFQHEMLVALPQSQPNPQQAVSTAAVDGAAAISSSSRCMVVRVACMAVGSTWVQVCVPKQSIGAHTPGEFLSHILRQLQQHLGQHAVYVASAWSQLGAPKGLDSAGSGGVKVSPHAHKQMWVLLPNHLLQRGVHVVLDASTHVTAAVAAAGA